MAIGQLLFSRSDGLRAGLFAALAAALMADMLAPALAKIPAKPGSEKIIYVRCGWMSGPREKAVSQIEEVRWRDEIETLPDGRESVRTGTSVYTSQLREQMAALLGTGRTMHCEIADAPDYGKFWPSFIPGTTANLYDGPTPVVLKKIDPNWFIVERVRKNMQLASVGAAGKAPVIAKPKPVAPAATPTIMISGGEEKARQAALTKARIENMRSYEQRQVQGLIKAGQRTAQDKAAIEKFKAYLRERGRRQ